MSLTPQQLIELGKQTLQSGTSQVEIDRKMSIEQVKKNPLKPTISQMPLEARQRAELVKTSSIFKEKGLKAAQKRMKTNSVNYEFIPEASTTDYIVARNKKTNKIEIAFRGTDPTALIESGFGKGIPEPIMWGNILATGNEGNVYDQHKLEDVLENIKKHGINVSEIGHIAGYSMGGTKAHRLGDMLGVSTTLLNPLLGKNFFDKPLSPRSKHHIYRTTEDIATAQGLMRPGVSMPTNVTIDSIDPVPVLKEKTKGITGTFQDVVALHDLDHFVVEGDRNSDVRDADDEINDRIEIYKQKRQGKTKEEQRKLQDEMLEDIKPHLEVLAEQNKKFKARTGVMRNIINIGTSKPVKAGATLAGGLLTAQAIKKSGKPGANLIAGEVKGAAISSAGTELSDAALEKIGVSNPYIRKPTAAAAGATINEGLNILAGAAPSLVNLKNAVLSAGISTSTQQVTSEGLYRALRAVGVDDDTAGIVSEGVGGGTGGATSVIIPEALKAAARRSSLFAARQAAIATSEQGVEMAVFEAETEALAEAGTEALAEAGVEAGSEALLEAGVEAEVEAGAEMAAGEELAGSLALIPIPGFRLLAGAVLLGTLASAGAKVYEVANRPATQVILHPSRSEAVDHAIATNETIKKLINDFNNSKDRSKEAYDNLLLNIQYESFHDPRIPKNFSYVPTLIKATEENKNDIVLEYDYSHIPQDIQNMGSYDFDRLQGQVALQQNFPEISAANLSDQAKRDFIRKVTIQKGNFSHNLPNADLNYIFTEALKFDKGGWMTNDLRRDIKRAQEETRQAREKIEKIQQVVADYTDEVNVTNIVHKQYADFMRTSPKVNEFLDNGDIDGLNEYLLSTIRDKDVAGAIYHSLTPTHNKQEVLQILHNNIPQFNALGQVLYVKAGDPPVRISQNVQERNIREAQSLHRMGMYTEITSKLQESELGRHLLERSPVGQLLNKGGTPQEINMEIDKFYKTHPHFAAKVNRGLIAIPKIEADGSVIYKQKDISQITQEEHIDRRKQIHSLTIEEPTQPLDLGITPTQVEQPSTQSAGSQ